MTSSYRDGRRAPFLAVAGAVLAGLVVGAMLGSPGSGQAALQTGNNDPEVLIGEDDDNLANPLIQPADEEIDQSMANADILAGAGGADVLIGLLGSDVLQSGAGRDMLVGGTEQGTKPNSDIMDGGSGNDVSIWAPGDGSDAFLGGAGLDAEVFGIIDKDGADVPILSDPIPGHPTGVPTADVTGSSGFCTLDRVPGNSALGYEFLARFFSRSSGDLLVTIRLAGVEQVFCTSEAGGEITFADLTDAYPRFEVVSLAQVYRLNPDVAAAIR